MASEPEKLLGAVTSHYAAARGFLSRLSAFVAKVTFKIPKGGSPGETIDELGKRWALDEEERLTLHILVRSKPGLAFFDEKIQSINRAAFHRSAFVLNAATQLFFVDIGAQLYISAPQLKLVLVVANVLLVAVAHFEIKALLKALIAGPNALPPKRRFWGLFSNPEYNRAVKKHSRHYARSAWKEKSLYRPAYFLDAASIFLGAQFILAPERVIFPFGFILGKTTGLFTTLVMMFDVWRGVRAGEDARIAREREIAVYRDLDV
ncbi:hypothetical protein OGR47_17605 [Methylocystis sp. MJC1]|jgi:hypothetical protein|uniref:hypothetical protein n=1 Tax=Methylocystis sp. MJC1 TaxID=2654282 RepID=UPI0013E9F067|nr:hypothetical protein [Methylocystis sp. MJC1]KAF2990022.1 hypothetical protein MJC1_02939 [Methylocystis sp. MJC1]MBU6528774.1 hypothetical protein [Methylocystis sp. MJC1]UZX11660.1 hypothetical protein OGR47_17605 [Methylocystis sp. MJC1]